LAIIIVEKKELILMLKINSSWESIKESHIINNKGEFINLQDIKEKLLRLTVKWTEYYATDILIFFDLMNKYFLQENIIEVDFYFRQMGVDWVIMDHNNEIREVIGITDKYRGLAKLIFNGDSIVLYWKIGNC